MPGKLEGLYRLQKKDVARASVVLADAFQPDPVWRAVLQDATVVQQRCAFETPVRYCLKYGEVYAPSKKLGGHCRVGARGLC